MPIPKKSILLRNLKNYLTFLKDHGFSEIPSKSGVSLEFQSDIKGLPCASIDTDKTSHMKTNINTKAQNIQKLKNELAKSTSPNVRNKLEANLNLALKNQYQTQKEYQALQTEKIRKNALYKQLKNEKENLVLYRGQESYVLMNLYPYSNCHILIAPYAHTADTNEIRNTGNKEIMWLANKSMNILRKTTGAEGFNFGANIGKAGGAGIEEHLHYHIVPRWTGDTNFMPVVGNTKVMVQGLTDSWEKLKPHFDTLGKA